MFVKKLLGGKELDNETAQEPAFFSKNYGNGNLERYNLLIMAYSNHASFDEVCRLKNLLTRK